MAGSSERQSRSTAEAASASVSGLDAPRTLAERCRAIEWLVLDVDGVLTEGSIIYADNEIELKHFHVRDGAGLKIWQLCGKRTAIISGRTSAVVQLRAAELGITPVLQGSLNKLPGFRGILTEHGVQAEQVCFVGDDVPDLPLLQSCGLAVAVADAVPDLFRAAHYVTQTAGGRGAVREFVELSLRCQGHWLPATERLFEQGA